MELDELDRRAYSMQVLPAGLEPPEMYYFLTMRALYAMFATGRLTEEQAKQEAKEPAKESPVRQEKANAVSVQQLLNPETSERAVQALADAAMAAGYNAEAVGKAFTDLKIAAISSPLPEKQPDDQQPNKNLDMPLTAAALMDRDPVSKAGLFQFLGSQGVTKEAVVQQCTAWKNQADKYLQDKGLVATKEESKGRSA